jgi:2-polyprenyl-3-methyl-5-hydroxy-6-metoxy-1,4-benzoquinol methylase
LLGCAPRATPLAVGSDRHWIRFGRFDPYLRTVQTLDPYKLDPALEGEGIDRYFESGERYAADLFETIERHVVSGFRPGAAVDFGCSVGRVAIPLAKYCRSISGLDVSREALDEAAKNAARRGVTNARWLASDDELSRLVEPIDLFHSYNVLQHLSVKRGLRIVRRALGLLSPGGVLAVHFPYADRAPALRRAMNWVPAHIPGAYRLANVARGRPHDYPYMLMNRYDLAAMVSLVGERRCESIHCKLIDQGRYPGVLFIARVPTAPA